MSFFLLSYVDPGSGSILLQLVVGSLVGAGLFFRHSLFRVLQVFRGLPREADGTADSTELESSPDRDS